MSHNLGKAGILSAALLFSSVSQAALVTFTYTGIGTGTAVFSVDSAELVRAENANLNERGVQLLSASFTSTAGTTTAYDVTDPTIAYYGQDSNGETTRFFGGNNFYQGSSAGSAFTWDDATNEVTYSGLYRPTFDSAFIDFAFTGTSFDVNLTSDGILTDTYNFEGHTNAGYFISTNLHVEVSDVSSVPLPASVWLLGSGLIGLISVARRKRV